MRNNKFFGILFLLSISLIFISCNRTYYNAVYVFTDKEMKDTGSTKLNIRIINEGKIGISSIKVLTDSGYVFLRGVKPKDTGRYYVIPPIYNRPKYEVQIVEYDIWGRTQVLADGCCVTMWHDTDLKLTSGYYSIYVKLEKEKKEIRLRRFHIGKSN